MTFPLLANEPGPYRVAGQSCPRCFSFSDGSSAPLFVSGVVTAAEVGRIARHTAERIVEGHGGQRLLLVQVLEGGRTFAELVIAQLASLAEAKGVRYEVATIQVRSYGQGTEASAHQVLQPLRDRSGREVTGDGFDGVVVIDDLIDGGQTVAWLVTNYFAGLALKNVGVCTMLVKERERSPEVEALLAGCLISGGKLVPDEWLVGYGLDLAIPGTDRVPGLYLFRQALPGGIYAFNRAMVRQLIADYQADPEGVCRQLAVYLSPA